MVNTEKRAGLEKLNRKSRGRCTSALIFYSYDSTNSRTNHTISSPVPNMLRIGFLFIPQRIYRAQPCCSVGRIEAEDKPDSYRD